jgi:uncharacterized repeat protein (TIGR04138 family)
MTMHYQELAAAVRRDPRYAYEAYEFVFAALGHTQKLLGRLPKEGPGTAAGPQHHVKGPELLEGIRDLALREFGLMARTVFRLWGVQRTDDFGEIVFNLVEWNLMMKTDDDCRGDFHNVYDFEQALVKNFRIELEEAD